MIRRFQSVVPAEGPASPWGPTLWLSLGLHVLGFALAVGIPRLVPRAAASPVYVVDLVSLPGGPANASPPPPAAQPAQAAPAAEKPKLPPVIKEDKAVKIPDRDKKPEVRKTPEPRPTPPKPAASATPPPAPTAAAATAPHTAAGATPAPQGTPPQGASMSGVSGGSGSAGGGFGGSGAAQTDAINFYVTVVTRNIENAWKKPIFPPGETSRAALTTQIRVVLSSSGRVINVTILVPSGYEAMDRSILDAVHEAIFPPFPSSLSYASLPIPIEIVLTRD